MKKAVVLGRFSAAAWYIECCECSAHIAVLQIWAGLYRTGQLQPPPGSPFAKAKSAGQRQRSDNREMCSVGYGLVPNRGAANAAQHATDHPSTHPRYWAATYVK